MKWSAATRSGESTENLRVITLPKPHHVSWRKPLSHPLEGRHLSRPFWTRHHSHDSCCIFCATGLIATPETRYSADTPLASPNSPLALHFRRLSCLISRLHLPRSTNYHVLRGDQSMGLDNSFEKSRREKKYILLGSNALMSGYPASTTLFSLSPRQVSCSP